MVVGNFCVFNLCCMLRSTKLHQQNLHSSHSHSITYHKLGNYVYCDMSTVENECLYGHTDLYYLSYILLQQLCCLAMTLDGVT